MIALILWNVLLFGGVFYSGHLFVVSMFFIFAAWRLLSAAAFPFVALEAVSDDSAFGRKKSMLLMGVLLVAAIIFDGFMASRFDSDEAAESERAPSAVNRQR